MLDIPKVSKRILKMLDAADWSVETLAKAQPEDLEVIEGIGPATAWRVIVAARREHRAARANEPVLIDPQWLTPPPETDPIARKPPLGELPLQVLEGKFVEVFPGEPIPAMAVRVKRGWLVRRLQEAGVTE